MTCGGREETRPEIQSSGNKRLLRRSRLGTVDITQQGHTGGCAWQAGNLVWSLCFTETGFDTGDGLKWKS